MLPLRVGRQIESSSLKVPWSILVSASIPRAGATCPPFCPTGRQVWAFRGYDPLPDYPKSISTFGLPATVARVDAALYDEQAGKISFFAGSMHYRCVISISSAATAPCDQEQDRVQLLSVPLQV